MPVVLHPDPFNAVLLSSPALRVSLEQQAYIKKVLDKACSDSLFSDKAYLAIWHILTAGNAVPPVITSLNPATAQLGSPSFTLEVIGTGFKSGSIIVFAGQNEPTTFVSATKLTTGVDMSVWLGPDALPVSVLNPDGVDSDPMLFTFTAAPEAFAFKKEEVKKEEKVVTKK